MPLVEAAAKYYSPILKRDIDAMTEIVTVPGYKTGLTIYLCSLITKKATVILFEPCNPDWVKILEKDGFSTKIFPINLENKKEEFEKTVEEAELMIVPNAGIVDGRPLGMGVLEYFASIIQKNEKLKVVSDESLHGYCEPDRYVPLSSLPGMEDRVLTMMSGDAEFYSEGTNMAWFIGSKSEIDLLFSYEIWNYFSACSIAMYALAKLFEKRVIKVQEEGMGCILEERKLLWEKNFEIFKNSKLYNNDLEWDAISMNNDSFAFI